MMELVQDATDYLLRRQREIERHQDFLPDITDRQELAEREEAARAYATENEKHFVDYLNDCLKQSVDGYKDVRATWDLCYNVYKENKPFSWSKKESWQSQIVIPKPFQTVQYGASAIEKAFTPKFLSLHNWKNTKAQDFWQKVLDNQLNENHAKFPIRFGDSSTMSLAVGVSQELIPRWVPGQGLEFILVEPWKIHRDPDTMSRDNQSGLYWIHQEWLDAYVLQDGQTKGRYQGVERASSDVENVEDPLMTKEAIAQRKNLIWQRSSYRKMIQTSEFYGTVLDSKGRMLLPRATYTVAGGVVIGLPKTPLYNAIRWPGVSYSPLPDLLRFGGRGLLEGIVSVWEAMNNIMCLHQDYLLWIVNPMTEINVDALDDPRDVKGHPGKDYLVHDTVNGQAAVRTVDRRFVTNEILANLQYHDQNYQRGSFMPDVIQGLPGWRKDVTYREQAQNLDQALGVYSLMGKNIEQGAIEAIVAAAETIYHHATYQDYLQIFSREELRAFGVYPNPKMPNGVSGVPPVDGTFHVSGIQAIMKDQEALMNLRTLIIPMMKLEGFAPYLKPYKILKSIETRTNLQDEGIIATEDEARQIDEAKKAQMENAIREAREARELEEANAALDLVDRMDEGRGGPANPNKSREEEARG